MPARLAIHVPTQAVAIRVLTDGSDLVVGRSPDCDCVLAHESVSRRHARLYESQGRWIIEDLGSKNGIRVGGHCVAGAELTASQWLAIGDVFCEFEPIDDEAVQHLTARAAHRRESSQLWIDRLSRSQGVDTLIETLLGGIVNIAECRRGFLLVTDDAQCLRVRACHTIDPMEFGGVAFSGSRSAVDRAIVERRAVFLSDRRDHDWLAGKASVIARGIRALVALPLEQDGALLGVAYADTDNEAKIFTDLDADLLHAFAARASAALAAAEIHAALSSVESAIAGDPALRRFDAEHAPSWNDTAARRSRARLAQ